MFSEKQLSLFQTWICIRGGGGKRRLSNSLGSTLPTWGPPSKLLPFSTNLTVHFHLPWQRKLSLDLQIKEPNKKLQVPWTWGFIVLISNMFPCWDRAVSWLWSAPNYLSCDYLWLWYEIVDMKALWNWTSAVWMGGLLTAIICFLFPPVNHSLQASVKSLRAARHRPDRNSCKSGAPGTGLGAGWSPWAAENVLTSEKWVTWGYRIIGGQWDEKLDFCSIRLIDQMCFILSPSPGHSSKMTIKE